MSFTSYSLKNQIAAMIDHLVAYIENKMITEYFFVSVGFAWELLKSHSLTVCA